MSTFKDLQRVSEEVSYRQGVERGLTLMRDRQFFLEKTTLAAMRRKGKQKEYIALFNTVL